jgi:hypothetical protein
VERIEPTVAKLAAEFPAWGHRKIWALHNLDHPDALTWCFVGGGGRI